VTSGEPANRTRILIRARDLSQAGHVHNVVYLSYVEEATRAFFDPIFGADYVLARVEVDYRSELLYADREIDARLEIERIGNSSVVAVVTLAKADGEVAASARCVFVTVDADGSRPLTDEERALVASGS
jgi:acyl-CoA thioesterase FadM